MVFDNKDMLSANYPDICPICEVPVDNISSAEHFLRHFVGEGIKIRDTSLTFEDYVTWKEKATGVVTHLDPEEGEI